MSTYALRKMAADKPDSFATIDILAFRDNSSIAKE